MIVLQDTRNRERIGILLFVVSFGVVVGTSPVRGQSSLSSSAHARGKGDASSTLFIATSANHNGDSRRQMNSGAANTQDPGQDAVPNAVDIVRDPSDVAPPVGNREPQIVKVSLVAQELEGKLNRVLGTTYEYWTFNGKVPGPMIRVRQGDTLELTLKNEGRLVSHSIDLHAALGPGGGMELTEAKQGESKTFTFKAAVPGVFVYHCGTNLAAQHIANGMYGLIIVEPPGGLPHVGHEFYVMQGEIYTVED